jgi:2',3'-cyclic-nucleotide 2'-phosphodiesterase / 3'-nucleotidase / 5'-nucleotidase
MKKEFALKLMYFLLLLTLLCTTDLTAQYYDTEEKAMMTSVSQRFKSGWTVDPVLTVGETNSDGMDYSLGRFDYRVPGLMDGMYAFKNGTDKIDLLVTHELQDGYGYPYTLQNGTVLTGARITKFRIKYDDGNFGIKNAELAYDRIYDRYYDIVTSHSQIDEGINPASLDGIDRLCSANGVEKGKYGFEDNIFFAGEETGPPFDVRGGQQYALDVKEEKLYTVPAMGRAAWENVCVMDNFDSDKVVMLIGDDRPGAPLLMYIGEKDESFTNDAPDFLEDNGLAKGYLYVWVSDNGDRTPEQWNGTGTDRQGKFVRINTYNPGAAGLSGWDAAGWADIATQDAMGELVGRFNFSRPEDLETNPQDGSQAVFASTGRSALYPSDSWGTVYLIDIDEDDLEDALEGDLEEINQVAAKLTILYDGDDAGAGQFSHPDWGVRSPDNLTWAADGYVYINEDKSVNDFCLTSKMEASVWQLNPENGALNRILEMDRSAVPYRQSDSAVSDCGNWESSGVIDVSKFFTMDEDDVTVLLLNTQGHSIDNVLAPDSPIGSDNDLSEGGQLIFAYKKVDPIVSDLMNMATPNGADEQEEMALENTNVLSAYPNPTEDMIQLNKVANVFVYNAIGTLVYQAENVSSIDVTTFETGIYLVKTDQNESVKVIVK